MTDRIFSLTVILDREYRDDDVEAIADAVRMVRGVASVENGPVADVSHHMNKQTIFYEVQALLLKALDEYRKGDS